MRHESVTVPTGNGPKPQSSAGSRKGIDWKGIGYLFSIAGVLLMGAEAIPKPNDPWWYWPALGGGVVTSIIGFALRYMAHLKQRREIEQTKREAEQH